MSIRAFLNFVEIRTKLASIIPFILGSTYAIYHYNSFKFINFLIMLVSLLAFDMATTAINNYCDYLKTDKSNVNSHEMDNAIIKNNLKISTALNTIIILLFIAIVFGVLLVFKTNLVVLLIGFISFSVGIMYTFGPIPISRMPLGELFSGTFMGFVILFLSVYTHVFDENIVNLLYNNYILTLNIKIIDLICILIFSIPSIVGIANIMLANNICDLEKDILNKRFTLPYYIGKNNALKLFRYLYYLGYLSITLSIFLKIIPTYVILTIFTLIPVHKNIVSFTNEPIKSKTFALSVKNFVLMNLSQIIIIGLAIIFT